MIASKYTLISITAFLWEKTYFFSFGTTHIMQPKPIIPAMTTHIRTVGLVIINMHDIDIIVHIINILISFVFALTPLSFWYFSRYFPDFKNPKLIQWCWGLDSGVVSSVFWEYQQLLCLICTFFLLFCICLCVCLSGFMLLVWFWDYSSFMTIRLCTGKHDKRLTQQCKRRSCTELCKASDFDSAFFFYFKIVKNKK